MRLNFIKNVTSNLQCRKPVATGQSRRGPRSDSVKKVLQLQAERLVLNRRQGSVPDGHGWFDGEADGILARVVQGNILVWLEQAELTHALGRDSAGSKIR